MTALAFAMAPQLDFYFSRVASRLFKFCFDRFKCSGQRERFATNENGSFFVKVNCDRGGLRSDISINNSWKRQRNINRSCNLRNGHEKYDQ